MNVSSPGLSSKADTQHSGGGHHASLQVPLVDPQTQKRAGIDSKRSGSSGGFRIGGRMKYVIGSTDTTSSPLRVDTRTSDNESSHQLHFLSPGPHPEIQEISPDQTEEGFLYERKKNPLQNYEKGLVVQHPQARAASSTEVRERVNTASTDLRHLSQATTSTKNKINPSRGPSIADEIRIERKSSSNLLMAARRGSSSPIRKRKQHQYFGSRATIVHNTVEASRQLFDLESIQKLKLERLQSESIIARGLSAVPPRTTTSGFDLPSTPLQPSRSSGSEIRSTDVVRKEASPAPQEGGISKDSIMEADSKSSSEGSQATQMQHPLEDSRLLNSHLMDTSRQNQSAYFGDDLMEKGNTSQLVTNPNDTSIHSHGLEESKRTQIRVHESSNELHQSRDSQPSRRPGKHLTQSQIVSSSEDQPGLVVGAHFGKQLDQASPIETAAPSEQAEDIGEDVNAHELDQLVFNLVELVTASDPEGLQIFLENVIIDVTQIFDDRGFNLAHIASLNNDHKTLDILISYSFSFWGRFNDVTRSQSLHLLQEWVNQQSRPPSHDDESEFRQSTAMRRISHQRHGSSMVFESKMGSSSMTETTRLKDSSRLSPSERITEQEDDGTRPIHFAAYHGNHQLIDILINSGADPSLTNRHGQNVMHMAAQGDKPFSLIFFRQNYKHYFSDINVRDEDNCTPLHWACYCNSHSIINFLISLDANVNVQDRSGSTPLHISIKQFDWKDPRKQFVTIQRLWHSGANPKIKDQEGKNAILLAKEFQDQDISNALVKILKEKKIPFIETGHATGRYKIISGVFLLVMTVVIGGYVTFLYFSKSQYPWELEIITTFAVLNILTYVVAMFKKPDYSPLPEKVASHDDQLLDLLKRIQHQPNKKICAYCKTEKPEKARHCFICKRCVLEHDRHMLIINNCVGHHNRRFVIAYLIASVMLLGFITLSSALHFLVWLPKDESGNHKQRDDTITDYIYIDMGTFMFAFIGLLVVIYNLLVLTQSEIRSRRRLKIARIVQAYHDVSVSSDNPITHSLKSSNVSIADMEKQFEKNLKAERALKVSSKTKQQARKFSRKNMKTPTQKKVKIGPANIDNLDSSGDDSEEDVEILRMDPMKSIQGQPNSPSGGLKYGGIPNPDMDLVAHNNNGAIGQGNVKNLQAFGNYDRQASIVSDQRQVLPEYESNLAQLRNQQMGYGYGREDSLLSIDSQQTGSDRVSSHRQFATTQKPKQRSFRNGLRQTPLSRGSNLSSNSRQDSMSSVTLSWERRKMFMNNAHRQDSSVDFFDRDYSNMDMAQNQNPIANLDESLASHSASFTSGLSNFRSHQTNSRPNSRPNSKYQRRAQAQSNQAAYMVRETSDLASEASREGTVMAAWDTNHAPWKGPNNAQ